MTSLRMHDHPAEVVRVGRTKEVYASTNSMATRYDKSGLCPDEQELREPQILRKLVKLGADMETREGNTNP
jgi:hypothetical protein